MERPDKMLCPLVKRVISEELCYETVFALSGLVKLSTVPEMKIEDREAARRICDNCEFSNFD